MKVLDPMTIPAHDRPYQWGETATHPLVPRSRVLAALLLVAGIKPAASSRLSSPRPHDPLVRVQLQNQG